jgi:uncharacterized OB-fold protein
MSHQMTYQKPLPSISPLDKPFWDFARKHELRLQRCTRCRKFRYPTSPVCADCDSDSYEWEKVSGRGKILSWVVFHHCYFPSFAKEIPYNVAIIALEEGPQMVSNILAPNDTLRGQMAVEVVFEDATDEISIPKFRPAP